MNDEKQESEARMRRLRTAFILSFILAPGFWILDSAFHQFA
jgi:hypothetical protein